MSNWTTKFMYAQFDLAPPAEPSTLRARIARDVTNATADTAAVERAVKIVAAWNARIARKEPADFYPTIGTAIRSGHVLLHTWCPACQQVAAHDLRHVARDHHPRAALSVLIPKLSCDRCCPNPPLAVLLDLKPLAAPWPGTG